MTGDWDGDGKNGQLLKMVREGGRWLYFAEQPDVASKQIAGLLCMWSCGCGREDVACLIIR